MVTSYVVANLYDGGWRAEDRDLLRREYDLTEDELNYICEGLAEITKGDVKA